MPRWEGGLLRAVSIHVPRGLRKQQSIWHESSLVLLSELELGLFRQPEQKGIYKFFCSFIFSYRHL